ncbi:MAG: cytochrome c [Rhodocyclales bacterium]|jgi:mono/diheme cytochrome c family protein|nr:cytochrome c [Rhodocyclales bacterium]
MKIASKFRKGAIIHAAVMMMGAAAATAIAADKTVDVGKLEYEGACAACHGTDGRGGGIVASQMSVRMPNLTQLASANRGVFPFDRVYQVIDGREQIKAHGTRDMPVWGQAFRRQSSVYFQNYPVEDQESNARSRILALTEYVYRLQVK